jgi:hypothetical protein
MIMIRAWQKFGIVLVMALAVVACNRVEPVYNVEEDAIPDDAQPKLSSEQVGNIITKVAVAKGWTVHKVKPGELRCTIKWHDHSAVAIITYSKMNYSIELDSSQNLKEADGMIHRKYNERVQELQNEIDLKLSQTADH